MERKRLQDLENERLRLQQYEIEETQRKVRELKEALERSRLENSQDLQVIKKIGDSTFKNNRYAGSLDSNEESDRSKPASKKQLATLTVKDGHEVIASTSQRSSKALSKVSDMNKSRKSIVSATDKKNSSLKYEGRRQTDNIRYTTSREQIITDTRDSGMVIVEGSYTKIELNLENSQDDIDFIGYGTMRVSSKKSRSPSPEMKSKFLKISPARNIPAEFEKDVFMTTRAFTPHSSYMSGSKERVVTTSSKKIVQSHIIDSASNTKSRV